MSWEELDINNPDVYAPRAYPRVQRAVRAMEGDGEGRPAVGAGKSAAWAEEEPGFVFDQDPAWGESLSTLEIDRAAQAAGTGGGRAGQQAPRQPRAPKPEAAQPAESKAKARGNRSAERAGRKGRKDHPYLYVSIITVCTLLMAVVIVMMMPQVGGYFWSDLGNYAFINGELLRYDPEVVATYKQYRDYMQQDQIYPGVFVDGTHVGGMTLAEAQAALANTGEPASMFSVTVSIGNQTWPFNSGNVPATRDLSNVLDRAYAIGRTNTTAILGTRQTPFRERVATALDLRESGVNLTTRAAYDHEAVRSRVNEIVAYVNRPATNAQIQSFDFATRTFAFTDGQVGVTVNEEELYDKLTASLDNAEQGTVVTVQPVLTQPTVTKTQLQSSFKMTAAFTTDTTSDKNRNNNIDLACQAINGTALMPGESFSFNKATGQRTTEKGYREAGAIAAGQSIEEVGGGICQVSSTLFNAVARANLEITSRSPHAWPSTYVNKGEDATVNWPNLDFQFKNNLSAPVFIITYYKDRKVSAEVWGLSLGDGVTIDLKSNVVKTMEPSSEVNYVNNQNLPYGTSKETIKARTGYVVETYKVWYQNGKEFKREKLHTSTYRAYQRTVEYN